MATYKVIDIYNGDTVEDWDWVQRNVKFLILKCSQGHSLSSSKYMFKDVKVDEYARECISRKIPFAVYHFFTAQNESEQIEEQKFQIDCVKYYIDYVNYIFCDVENYNNKYLLGQSRAELTKNVNVFCQVIEEAGFNQGYYTNPDHIKHFINQENIAYPLWIASYTKEKPSYPNLNIIGWQYGEGEVEGFKGDVDLNEFYVSMKSPRKPYLRPIEPDVQLHKLILKAPQSNQTMLVQAYLNAKGFTDLKGRAIRIDGYFDTYTKEAVEDFQLSSGLKVTGEVDEETWQEILQK